MKHNRLLYFKHLLKLNRLLLVSLLAAPLTLAAPTTGKLKLGWSYDPALLTSDLVFKVYYSTSLAVPLTNWTVLATLSGTNLTAVVQGQGGLNYFSMTASNQFGESDFSNVASAKLPGNVTILSLDRAP